MPVLPVAAFAQQIELPSDLGAGGQMLLEADQLVYDNDQQTVTAIGSVRIDYNGYKLVANRVSYNQKTGRLVAAGEVEILDRQGTKINSGEIDITDDFKDGFINALRVETAEKVYFGAESAERKDGYLTTFSNGVYTACEPCEDDPDKAPAWRIKARKIIWNGEEKTVRFENASFELFGMPIASLPYFEIADPTVKRKSGFLLPGIRYGSKLGYGLSVPYYFAMAPTYDLTVTTTGFTKQGFLLEADWRQVFDSGSYTLKMAGIHQLRPGEFAAGGPDRTVNRAMIGSAGRFAINPRWTLGWDVLAQTDKNFAYTYSLSGFNQYVRRNEIYLTGLNDRNFLDLRMMKFAVQESVADSAPTARNAKQPWVLPSFDYSRIADEPVGGGELAFNVNARVIKRDVSDISEDLTEPSFSRLRGAAGTNGRVTAEAEWKRTFITEGGLAVTPLLALRGDVAYQSAAASAAFLDPALNFTPAAEVRAAWYRGMATAGLDVRWPILFSTTSATHVLEPVAQIFARPSEMGAASHGLLNEDAQSLVFDATTLFERDKFSGYDRMEGGVRANLGLRYSGSFANGWNATALFGQSYHLAGVNSYASQDLVNAGQFSGLETKVSDFVAMAAIGSSQGFSASLKGRFDEKTFAMRRFEAAAGIVRPRGSFSARYAFIQGEGSDPLITEPRYGFHEDRQEIASAGTLKLNDRWTVFGSGTYDLISKTLVRDSVGVSYANFGKDTWCIGYTLTLAETRPVTAPHTPVRNIGFNISLRTLGDFGSTSSTLGGLN